MSGDLQAILQAIRDGNEQGFRRLVKAFEPALRSRVAELLTPRLSAILDVEDVVQDIWVTVYRYLPQSDFGSPAAFASWLRRVTQSRIIDLQRHHLGTGLRVADCSLDENVDRTESGWSLSRASLAAASQRSPSSVVAGREHTRIAEAVLESLSPMHREVILLSHVEQLTSTEIGARLGKSGESVRALLRRAHIKCRVALRKYGIATEPLRVEQPEQNDEDQRPRGPRASRVPRQQGPGREPRSG